LSRGDGESWSKSMTISLKKGDIKIDIGGDRATNEAQEEKRGVILVGGGWLRKNVFTKEVAGHLAWSGSVPDKRPKGGRVAGNSCTEKSI